MNFLLLEKQEISCGCFQNSQDNMGRIFRSSSDLSEVFGNKSVNLKMVKKISDTVNSKKKSLKKQKSVTLPCSQKNCHSRQLSKGQSNSTEVNQQISNQFQPKISNFNPMIIPKFYSSFEERPKSFYVSRQKVQKHYVQSEHIQSYSKSNSFEIAFQPINMNKDKFYQKLVDEQFKKDLQEFQLNMKLNEEKCRQKAAINFHKQKQESDEIKMFDQKNQIQEIIQMNQNEIFTQQQISELEKKLQKLRKTNKKKPQNNVSLQKIESSPQISQQKEDHQFQTASVLHKPTVHRQRKQSFRNSAISYKGRQLQTKKFKDKMYAKQIQSEKDGSSSESDKMSEVVGRGWDGLTQQRIQIEELDEMIYNEKKNGQTETMITQESHIKNSQIKTFTEYTSSFISPKTHKPTSLPFGAPFQKYGIIGMSYQHIDDFSKLNNSFLRNRKI